MGRDVNHPCQLLRNLTFCGGVGLIHSDQFGFGLFFHLGSGLAIIFGVTDTSHCPLFG